MWIADYWAWPRSSRRCLPLIVGVWFLAGVLFPSLATCEDPRGDLMRPGIECRSSDNFSGVAMGLWARPNQVRRLLYEHRCMTVHSNGVIIRTRLRPQTS